MTASVTIVNTSNWKDEDVILRWNDGKLKKARLKPGEKIVLGKTPDHNPMSMGIVFTENTEEKHDFFKCDAGFKKGYVQAAPKVTVKIEPMESLQFGTVIKSEA